VLPGWVITILRQHFYGRRRRDKDKAAVFFNVIKRRNDWYCSLVIYYNHNSTHRVSCLVNLGVQPTDPLPANSQ
jgi:hypothetical protein